jgi:hypothetical protein
MSHASSSSASPVPPKLGLLAKFFLILIVLGIPVNLLSNQYYDTDTQYTLGEWLITYEAGFVRRGLPGTIIHKIASTWGVQPAPMIWIVSVSLYIVLIFLFWRFCKGRFDETILLSPLFLLAPIIGNYLVRKDVLLLVIYGLILAVIQIIIDSPRWTPQCLILINILGAIAVFSHESFGFWALPSLVMVFGAMYARSSTKNANIYQCGLYSLGRALCVLLPTFTAFFICLLFKGSADQAVAIHQSWRGLSELFPRSALLLESSPSGAVEAIGWSTRIGLKFSYSTLSKFSSGAWIPAIWMLTIYICMNLFIGNGSHSTAAVKRPIVLFQFLMVSPLFVLGWDFGRWIFIWMSSSALFYGFLCANSDIFKPYFADSRARSVLRRMVSGLELRGLPTCCLLFFGIPECCWTVSRFWSSTPFQYSFWLARRFSLLIG